MNNRGGNGGWEQDDAVEMARDLIADIFLACRAQLARAVSRIVPPQDIEDIVQTTYVRACQYRAREEVNEPRALMLSIARNLALDHVKRAEHRLTRQFDSDDELELALSSQATDQAYETVASNEEFGHFCNAVRQLPLQCRRVFVLKKVYGHSQREIAQQLGIAESTVEKHIATGMHYCMRYIQFQPLEKGRLDKRQRDVTSAQRGRR
jgi:RNA polymerase sigma-70 factor (ECF subfamily)